MRKREQGAFAVEAVLGLTFFMLAILGLMMVSLIIRVESNLQYAVDQTAKELSSYYYILDAVGVAKYTSGEAGTAASEEVEKVNTLINNVMDFSGTVESAGNDIQSLESMGIEEISAIANDYGKLHDSAEEMWKSVEGMAEDPKGQVKACISFFAHSLGNAAMSYYVTPFLCRMLMPKYLAGTKKETDRYLESVGIEGGLEAIDFTHSSLLADGRTIRVVAIYKLNTKSITFGMIDADLYLHQTAVTAAWITPNDDTLKSISDAYKGS